MGVAAAPFETLIVYVEVGPIRFQCLVEVAVGGTVPVVAGRPGAVSNDGRIGLAPSLSRLRRLNDALPGDITHRRNLTHRR